MDLAGGQMDVMFDNLPFGHAATHQKWQAQGLGCHQRTTLGCFADVPTVEEAAGLKGFEATSWFGLLAPAGDTSPEIVNHIQQEGCPCAEPHRSSRKKCWPRAALPSGNSPADFARLIESEHVKWAQVVKMSGARVD